MFMRDDCVESVVETKVYLIEIFTSPVFLGELSKSYLPCLRRVLKHNSLKFDNVRFEKYT
jgi:hypothetical protein